MGRRTWIRPTPIVSEPVSVYSLNGFREVESSGPTKRKWAWDSRGAKVTSVWAADQTFTVPFSTADAWATVAAAVTKIPDDQDYYEVDVEPGKEYWWCSCGLSKDQPFCDGSHKGTEFKPKSFTVGAHLTLYLCGCKRTTDAPYCDGTHAML